MNERIHPIMAAALAPYVDGFDEARVDRKSRMLRIERHAHGVGLSALLLHGSSLPEFHEAELHAHFRQLAELLGYTITKGTEQ